ncbi:TPA: hypothetical protein EYP37_05820, partial [Candidatus Poribacteria bacterium]|nr:hypothetical protein [Candidatus Poribacteria bacterium]
MRLIIAILMVPIVIISTIMAIYVFEVSLSSLLIPPLAALLAGVAFVAVVYRYRRPKPDEALVRTGGKKAKVTITGGMWVNTIIHEIRPISLNTVRIEILREGPDSLITQDFNRADVEAVFYVRVEPKEENVLRAAQSLGERALTPETLRDLVESKVEGTLRAVAATMEIEDLLRKRAEFAQAVLEACREDLLENGLTLETVAITRIDQTPIESYDPNNRFDAQGLRNIAEVTQQQKMEKERIVKQREVEITEIDVNAQKMILDLKQDLAWKEADQAKNIAIYAAEREADTSVFQYEMEKRIAEAEYAMKLGVAKAKIAQEQGVMEREIEKTLMVELARINQERQVQLSEIEKNLVLETAQIDQTRQVMLTEIDKTLKVELARIAQEQTVMEREIEKNLFVEKARIAQEQQVTERDIERTLNVETARINQEQAVTLRDIEK